MNKYLCICGVGFNRKKKADDHVKVFSDVDNSWPHQVMKRNWKGRFLDFIFEFPWGKCFRLIGLTLILFVLEHHFKIDFTIWEATFLGLGIGLYVD